MYIENSVILSINIMIIVIFGWTIFKGFKDGFIATFLSLIASVILFFIAWPISRILAQNFILYQYNGINEVSTVIGKLVTQNINQILWYAILIVFSNIIVKILIKVAKGINETFIIGKTNQILGLILGFVVTVVYAAIIGFILNSGIFKNGNAVINHSILKLYEIPIKIGVQLGEDILKNDALLISSIINEDMQLSEEEKNLVIKSLKEKGVKEEVINKLLPLMR